MIYFFCYIFIINLLTLLVYGYDKRQAIKKKDRVEENILFFLAFVGGFLGALLGMQIYRHKTLKKKFYVWNILCFIIWIYLVLKFI